MAKAYYGPGSTGTQPQYTAPVPHAISNPPFFHTNKLLDTMTGAQNYDRMEREWLQRGMRALPESWDVLNPGGPGVAGLGAFATPSPFLFPGSLPEEGVRLPDGSVVNGSVGADGQIYGSSTGPGGRGLEGSLGQVNPGVPGTGGSGGSITFGGTGAPGGVGLDGDALLAQQRELAFNRLDDVDELFQSRLADLTNQALERQVAGTDTPFTDQRLAQMEARLASQSALADRGRRNRIREDFAGRGLGGSGAQADAELESMGRASAQRGQNLTNLLIQQAMENFQARERAQAGAQSWLAAQAAGIMPAILEEARMRSRFEVTGEGGADQDMANALTSMAMGQLQGPDRLTNPAAANTNLPFGPGSAGNISTPGGPPIRATGGVYSNNFQFTPQQLAASGQGGQTYASNTQNTQNATPVQQATQASSNLLNNTLSFGGTGAQPNNYFMTPTGGVINMTDQSLRNMTLQQQLEQPQTYTQAPSNYQLPTLNTGGVSTATGVTRPYGVSGTSFSSGGLNYF